MGGKVTVNFGPKFKFPLRNGKPLCQASSIAFSPEVFASYPTDDNPEEDNEIKSHTNNHDPMILNEVQEHTQKPEDLDDCIKSKFQS